MKFELTPLELRRSEKFRKKQNKKTIRLEKRDKKLRKNPAAQECWDGGYPYNTDYEYIFTPTSIGLAVKIKNKYTGDSKNITDYGSW
jgi:hypothetical protein